MVRKKALTGRNPLAYMGVEADSPPQLVIKKRAPTDYDISYYVPGDFWLNELDRTLFMLGSRTASISAWLQIFPATASEVQMFNADTGIATISSSSITFEGDTVITTAGSSNTLTYALSQGTDGQLLIGQTSGLPGWANLTSTGATVTVTSGSNSINLEGPGGSAIDYVTDSGTANPVSNTLNYYGGTNISTTGSGAETVINLDDDVDIATSLTVSTLGRGVVQSDSSGTLSSSEGTDGQLLIGSSSGAPAWANITSTDTSMDITNGANTINLEVTGAPVSRDSFLAQLESSVTTQLGSTIDYSLGDGTALTEIYDTGSNFDPGGAGAATFTAVTNGKYYFTTNLHLTVPATGGATIDSTLSITTSNRTYYYRHGNIAITTFSPTFPNGRNGQVAFSAFADMDIGDTATWQIKAILGKFNPAPTAANGDITLYGQSGEAFSYICGFLAA